MIRKQATPEEIQSLRANLNRLRPAQNFYFAYFDKAEGGSPSLLIEKKKIPPATVKDMLSKAVTKKVVRGLVRRNDTDQVIELLPLKSPGKLQRTLKNYYRRLPDLKQARIIVFSNEPDMIAARMEQAGEDLEQARLEEASLAHEIQQLEATVELGEQQKLGAHSAVEDAAQALKGRWMFQRKRAYRNRLEVAKAKEARRSEHLDATLAQLKAKRKALLLVEQERMQAEEDVTALGDVWSTVQTQMWEQRRAEDASWRKDFETQMSAMTSAAERLRKLEEEVEVQREQISAQTLSLQGLRLQRDKPDADPDMLASEISHAEVTLEFMQHNRQRVEEAIQAAQDECLFIEQQRNAVFMTESERERSSQLRVYLLDAQATAIQSETGYVRACEDEELAHAGLDEVHELHGELETLRRERNRLKLEVKHLKKTAKQWTYRKSSRRHAKQDAREHLPEKKAELEALKARIQEKEARLEKLEQDAVVELQHAKDATARRIQLERVDIDADLAVANREQDIAEESADIATWNVELRRKELEKQVMADPVMRRSAGERDQLLGIAERATSQVVCLEAELAELRDSQNDLAMRLAAAAYADPEETLQLTALSDEITEKSELLVRHRKDAEEHAQRSEQIVAEFDALLEKRALELKLDANPALMEAFRSMQAAEREQESAIRIQEESIDKQERLFDQLSEVTRFKEVHALILDGEAIVAKNAAIFAELRGMDLFESEDFDKVREAVGPAMSEVRGQLSTLAADLIRAGATADELAQVFERVPNGLRPPLYRDEVTAVNELIVRFDEMAERQAESDRDAFLIRTATEDSAEEMVRKIKDTLQELDQLRGDVSWVVGQATGKTSLATSWLTAIGALDGDEPHMETLNSVMTFLYRFNTGAGAVGAVKGAVSAFSADNPENDPVLQKLQDKQKLDALNGLVSSGLSIAKHIVPIVGLPRLGKNFLESVTHAAARTYRARTDAKLKVLARMEGSEMAGALQESLEHEWRLAEKYGFSATMNASWIANSVLQLADPSQTLSFSLAVSTKTASFAHDVVTSARDWKLAKKANTLLEQARKGDPRAKTELLKNHGRYAKGLLALKAQQGDAFALEYTASRGLTESDISGSSFEIITRYLLSESQQSNADHLETFDDWVAKRKALFGRLIDFLLSPLQYVWQTVSDGLEAPASIAGLELPSADLSAGQARELVALIRDGVDLRSRLSKKDTPTPEDEAKLTATLNRIDEMLSAQNTALTDCRDLTITQLEQISDIETLFQERMLDPLELSTEDKSAMLDLRPRLLLARREHIQLLTTLNEAI